jgi:hypothetical protein
MGRFIFILLLLYEFLYESFKIGLVGGRLVELIIMGLGYLIVLYVFKSFKFRLDGISSGILFLILLNLVSSFYSFKGYYELKYLLVYWIPRYALWLLLLTRRHEIGLDYFKSNRMVLLQILIISGITILSPLIAVKISSYLAIVSILTKGKWSRIYALMFIAVAFLDLSVRVNYVLIAVVLYNIIPRNILARALLVMPVLFVVVYFRSLLDFVVGLDITFLEGNSQVALLADTRSFIVVEIWNTMSSHWSYVLSGLPATVGYQSDFFAEMLVTSNRLHTEMLLMNFFMHLGLLGVAALFTRFFSYGLTREPEKVVLLGLLVCSLLSKPETLTIYNFIIIPVLFGRRYERI